MAGIDEGELDEDVQRVESTPGEAVSGFEDFYRSEYAPTVRVVFALTGRADVAEEIAQEAFLAAYRRWSQIASYDKPGAWVRRVAINRATSWFRRRKTELRALGRLRGGGTRASESPEPDEVLWAALRSLPTRQAQVLALMFVEDWSVAAVAEVLGCSQETVRTHARRGRQTLASRLADEDGPS